MATYKLEQRVKVDDEKPINIRVVEAKTQAGAIRHVTKDTISCELCSIADAMELAKAGVEIEKAKE